MLHFCLVFLFYLNSLKRRYLFSRLFLRTYNGCFLFRYSFLSWSFIILHWLRFYWILWGRDFVLPEGCLTVWWEYCVWVRFAMVWHLGSWEGCIGNVWREDCAWVFYYEGVYSSKWWFGYFFGVVGFILGAFVWTRGVFHRKGSDCVKCLGVEGRVLVLVSVSW